MTHEHLLKTSADGAVRSSMQRWVFTLNLSNSHLTLFRLNAFVENSAGNCDVNALCVETAPPQCGHGGTPSFHKLKWIFTSAERCRLVLLYEFNMIVVLLSYTGTLDEWSLCVLQRAYKKTLGDFFRTMQTHPTAGLVPSDHIVFLSGLLPQLMNYRLVK